MLILACATMVAACTGSPTVEYDEFETFDENDARRRAQRGTVLGGDGVTFGGSGSSSQESSGGGGVGGGIPVNAYLWRASLETLDFLPLSQTDTFGGVIITEWYAPPETRAERFKLNVFILARELRADGVKVTVFRQVFDETTSSWSDAPVDAATSSNLEDKILTRARQLRIASTGFIEQ